MRKIFTLLALLLPLTFATAAMPDGTAASSSVIDGQADESSTIDDYREACLEAIAQIEKIGNGWTFSMLTNAAKTSLRMAGTKDAMLTVMNTLRAGVAAYLQTVSSFTDGQEFTGMIGNHSFETGDMAQWFGIGFDMSQINITDIANAISSGNVSALAKAVTVNAWNSDTEAIRSEGDGAMADVHLKYYLNSRQMLMQPIVGLPAGNYRFAAKVACNPGILRTNKVHLSALAVPFEVVRQAISDVTSGNLNIEEIVSNIDLSQYAALFLEHGKMYTSSAKCSKLNTFSDAELDIPLQKGDIIVLGINAGLTPIIGTEQFRADNLTLTFTNPDDKTGEDEGELGVNSVKTLPDNAATYDISGRRYDAPNARGIIIKGGVKTFIMPHTSYCPLVVPSPLR